MPPVKRLTHVPHGTAAGFARHINDGDPPCKACVEARNQQDWADEQGALAHKFRKLEGIHSFNGDIMADWRRQAACTNQMWVFDETYEVGNKAYAITMAREVCASCPVIEQCRADGDTREKDITTHGFLAGETADQRRLRRRGAARAEEDAA